MRRRLLWLLAIAGVAWFWLRKSGARRPQPVVDIPPPAGDPADELRRKLDETKDRGDVSASVPDVPGGSESAAEDDLAAKRRKVHDRARSAADEMRGSSSD